MKTSDKGKRRGERRVIVAVTAFVLLKHNMLRKRSMCVCQRERQEQERGEHGREERRGGGADIACEVCMASILLGALKGRLFFTAVKG